MSVSMSDHDRDCPCFEDRFGKCNCKAQLIADFVAEITQLRAALEQSLAREAVYREWLERISCNLAPAPMGALGTEVDELLADPNPAVAELLRDRKIADAAREVEAIDRECRKTGQKLWQLIRASMPPIATAEEPSHDR